MDSDNLKIMIMFLVSVATTIVLYFKRTKNPPAHLRGGEGLSLSED